MWVCAFPLNMNWFMCGSCLCMTLSYFQRSTGHAKDHWRLARSINVIREIKKQKQAGPISNVERSYWDNVDDLLCLISYYSCSCWKKIPIKGRLGVSFAFKHFKFPLYLREQKPRNHLYDENLPELCWFCLDFYLKLSCLHCW